MKKNQTPLNYTAYIHKSQHLLENECLCNCRLIHPSINSNGKKWSPGFTLQFYLAFFFSKNDILFCKSFEILHQSIHMHEFCRRSIELNFKTYKRHNISYVSWLNKNQKSCKNQNAKKVLHIFICKKPQYAVRMCDISSIKQTKAI